MYRFAPSPTGDMHIGNLRAAIFNYICAKQSNDHFVLRIEDTDIKRNIEDKDKEILEILKLFNIDYEHLYYQSKNLKFHRQFASTLLQNKLAFACFCTPETLEEKRELAIAKNKPYRYDGTCEFLSDEEVLNNPKAFTIRLKKPSENISFVDAIKGNLSFEPENIDSFVIMRQDKYPTYNFACAIDDMIQGITHIIRGEDHVSNTPKQELIRKYLNYDQNIKYAHLPIILNEEGKKMSKREDSASVKWLLSQGFLPNAIANYLILLGNKTPKEIFTLEESFEWFDLKKISKSPARFDLTKLRQINKEHIYLLDDEILAKKIGYDDRRIGALSKLYLEEASTIEELKPKIKAIFLKRNPPKELEENFLIIKNATLNALECKTFDEFKEKIIKETSLKGKNLFKPLRFLFTNSDQGPELKEIYGLINPFLKEVITK